MRVRFHKLLKSARFVFTIPVPLVSGLDSYQSDSFHVLIGVCLQSLP